MKQGHNQKYKENVVDSINWIMNKTKDHYSWSSNIETISNEKNQYIKQRYREFKENHSTWFYSSTKE